MARHKCPHCGETFTPEVKSKALKTTEGAFTRAFKASRKLYKKHDTDGRNSRLFALGYYAPWYRRPSHV